MRKFAKIFILDEKELTSFQADCLVVHDQLTEVNGVSLRGLSKRSAMNTLHRAMQLDGPIHGHIQLEVVRREPSSVTHTENADDFVYGPNDQIFQETHHAKYSPTRDMSSPESHRLDCLDSGDIVGSNLPINPHISVRQHDYHHASFQHKPMQKSDSKAMMQKQVKETKSVNIGFLLENLFTLCSCYTHQIVKEKKCLDWFSQTLISIAKHVLNFLTFILCKAFALFLLKYI